MFRVYRKFDDLMFDRVFQPLVDRFPDAGPGGVARFFLTGYMLTCAIACALTLQTGEYAASFIWAMALGLYSLDYGNIGRTISQSGARNSRRIGTFEAFIRFVMWAVTLAGIALLTAVIDPIDLCNTAGALLYLAYSHSAGCDKLPPKAKKAKLRSSIAVRIS